MFSQIKRITADLGCFSAGIGEISGKECVRYVPADEKDYRRLDYFLRESAQSAGKIYEKLFP